MVKTMDLKTMQQMKELQRKLRNANPKWPDEKIRWIAMRAVM